ncbi:MAG: hypothetical protein QOE46_989 [Acidobacteriota bacterium]|jgi:hypothetical protein|nr:hypothetical protein [Acidobacteriota bacterium]
MNLARATLLVILLLALGGSAALSQSSNLKQERQAQSNTTQTAVTRDGRTVILKSDGTWEYAKEADDPKTSYSTPDERTILEVSTDPISFVGKPIVADGILAVSSIYWFGTSYAKAQDTHLSFTLRDAKSSGIHVYMKRGEAANNLRQKLLANGSKMAGSFTFVIREGGIITAELIDYKLSP